MLNTLVNATEKSLPALIREHVRQDFNCIYDDKYSIEELLSFSAKLKSDDEILAGYSGNISSKAIEAYIRFYANKIGIDLSSIQMPDNESGDGSLIRQFLQQHIGLKIEDLSFLDLHNLECFNPLSSLWG